MLTSDSEGLSLALMEAMLCGLPAVVSDVGDLPELVEQGVERVSWWRSGRPRPSRPRCSAPLETRTRLAPSRRRAPGGRLRYDVRETARRWDDLFLAR